MVKQIFTLIEKKVPPSCVAAILFHCTIHYTILLARCFIMKVKLLQEIFLNPSSYNQDISILFSINNFRLFYQRNVFIEGK